MVGMMRDNVSPEETRRVGWIVRDMAWAQGINLKVAEIITSDTLGLNKQRVE